MDKILVPPPPPGVRMPGEETDTKKLLETAARDAIFSLVEIANSPNPKTPASAKVAAIKELLDRTMGKATQPVEITVTGEEYIRQMRLARNQTVDVTPDTL